MTKDIDVLNSDDDRWEFVWFRNVNNGVYETTYYNHTSDKLATMYATSGSIVTQQTGYKVIGCNTDVFDPEDLVVMTNIINSNRYKERIKSNTDAEFSKTKYPLYYRLFSYEGHHEDPQYNHYGVFKYLADYKLNGLHRVSRQGGGEYFIQPYMSSFMNSRSVLHSSPDPNPDRMAAYKSRPGLGSHCFAFCPNTSNANISYEGDVHGMASVSKDNSWFYGTNITTIRCSDASYAIRKEEDTVFYHK